MVEEKNSQSQRDTHFDNVRILFSSYNMISHSFVKKVNNTTNILGKVILLLDFFFYFCLKLCQIGKDESIVKQRE